MIRIGSDTDIGMNRNNSDWLGMNSHPIFSPGTRTRGPIAMSCTQYFSEPTVLRNARARVTLRCQVRTTLIRSLIIMAYSHTVALIIHEA